MKIKSFAKGLVGGMVIGAVVGGAILFNGCKKKNDSGLEGKLDQGVVARRLAEQGRSYDNNAKDNVENVAERYVEEKFQENIQGDVQRNVEIETQENPYSFLEVYDGAIKTNVSYFNQRHNINLDSDLIKAMIFVESGSKRFRDGIGNDDAFRYDPMQIANQGDYALRVLSKGGEDSDMIGDFSQLRNKRHTPWRQGNWDYSNSNMAPEDSIYGGIGWLLNKSVENIETGDVGNYIIKSGDTLWNIAEEHGSTFETLKKYNQDIDINDLKIGQRIKFRSAYRGFNPEGIDWKEALGDYNGGGNPDYVSEVMDVYQDLKELKGERK